MVSQSASNLQKEGEVKELCPSCRARAKSRKRSRRVPHFFGVPSGGNLMSVQGSAGKSHANASVILSTREGGASGSSQPRLPLGKAQYSMGLQVRTHTVCTV